MGHPLAAPGSIRWDSTLERGPFNIDKSGMVRSGKPAELNLLTCESWTARMKVEQLTRQLN